MISNSITQKEWKRVMVGFGGESEIWWLRFLKKGFKHCFVILSDDNVCVAVDPICCRTEIGVFPALDFVVLREFFEANRYTVIETKVRKTSWKKYSLGLFSCVEVAKRILGIHNLSIITPYNLYLFLQNEKK